MKTEYLFLLIRLKCKFFAIMRLSSCCFCMSLYIGSIFIGVYIAVSSDDFILDLKGLNSALTKTVYKNISRISIAGSILV